MDMSYETKSLRLFIRDLLVHLLNKNNIEKILEKLVKFINEKYLKDNSVIEIPFLLKKLVYYNNEILQPILTIIFELYNFDEFSLMDYKELFNYYRKNKNVIVLLWLFRYPWKPFVCNVHRAVQKQIKKF